MVDEKKEELYVEVIYPNGLWGRDVISCPWGGKSLYAAEYIDTEPLSDGTKKDIFRFAELQSYHTFPPSDRARKFAEDGFAKIEKWPDACQGEPFTIRILESDQQTEKDRKDGIVGNQKPQKS